MISASVELCETEICFLHIQLSGTNMLLPKMHKTPPVRVFKVSCKIRVWQCFPHDNIVCSHMYDGCKRSNEIIVCHSLLSISSPQEQVYSKTINMSSLPVRAKYKHLRTIWAHTFDNSPTDPISFFWFDGRVATLYTCWDDLVASSQYLSTHFFAWPSIS